MAEEKLKIKWKVAERPTGRWRSFEQRSWPSAETEDGQLLATISCVTEYSSKKAKSGEHGPLKMFIYDYSEGVTNRKMKKVLTEAKSLTEAKEVIEKILGKHPEMLPKSETDTVYDNVKCFLDQTKGEIENFVEKVQLHNERNFLRSATISHLAYLFINGKRQQAAGYLDRWVSENK